MMLWSAALLSLLMKCLLLVSMRALLPRDISRRASSCGWVQLASGLAAGSAAGPLAGLGVVGWGRSVEMFGGHVFHVKQSLDDEGVM